MSTKIKKDAPDNQSLHQEFPAGKLPYQEPELVDAGSISELTQTSTNSGADGSYS